MSNAPFPPSEVPPPLPGSPAPLPGALTVDRDLEHLKVLSICWFVWAGLTALPALLFILYVVGGVIAMVVGLASRDAAPAAAIGGAFVCMGIVMTAVSLGLGYLYYRCGMGLRLRRHMTLCYVAAALSCLSLPLGLVLAIFTFVVLSRPQVKAMFT